MKEQKIAQFLLNYGLPKSEIIHFINRCRVIPMVGTIYHIKNLSSKFYNLLNEVIRQKNVKNNYQIDGICLRQYIINTFDL